MNYTLDLDLENICRVCLTQNAKLVNLFTAQIVDGYMRTMPEIIKYSLDMTVDERDNLPKKICETCKATVISYFGFKERCKRTENVLFEALKDLPGNNAIKKEIAESVNLMEVLETESIFSITEISEMSQPTEEIRIAAEITEKEPDVEDDSIVEHLEEEMCLDEDEDAEETVSSVESVDQLASSKTVPKIFNFSVNEEPKTFVRKRPPVDVLNISIANLCGEENECGSEACFCEYCDKEYPCEEYMEHCRQEHFMCSDCYIAFESQKELAAHRKAEHSSSIGTAQRPKRASRNTNTMLLCRICNKRYVTGDELRQHNKLHVALNTTAEKFDIFECSQCRSHFLKANDLDSHQKLTQHDSVKANQADDAICTDYQFLEDEKLESSENPICGYCTAAFQSMYEMRCHLIIHSGKFACPLEDCGCQYDSFARLSLHMMKKHVYEKEHFCSHCQRERFKTFDELQLHIRNDCSAKKFNCSHCDKKFFSNKALQLHVKSIGEKKHKCKLCNKTFAQQGELTIHLRTHTGERPFKCTICDKTYRTASMRAAHMDAHINGKTYQCTVCLKMLQSRTSYRNHVKRHTVGQIYKCTECTKSFYTKYHLDVHSVKVHHKLKEIDNF